MTSGALRWCESHTADATDLRSWQSFTIKNSFIHNHVYTSLVTAFHSHPPRGPGRRRGREPQIPGTGRLCAAIVGRNLLVSLSWTTVFQQDPGHRSRGNGQDWTRVLP